MNVATRTLIFATVAALSAATVSAQTTPQTPAQTPSQSSSQAPAQTQAQSGPVNGAYVSTDPLAGVKYDNRYDVSVGMAYGRLVAGPNLREGASLGGLDISGSYWLNKRWGVEASGRGYLGTSGAAPNHDGIKGPFVAQYMFLVGPEYLGPHNKHAAIVLHALFGGVYGDFNSDLGNNKTGPSGPAAFYDNQTTYAGAIGGHIDLNRSAHWVFRVTPDALLTGYDGTSQYSHTQWNFGISAGVEYKFKKKR